jgi:RimJ/RimL family protein N-acetyltransferase
VPVGFISYSAFHLKQHKAELDIWMNSEANCGKGYGSDAIITLGEYLRKTLGIQELIMRPSIKNVRANKSYEKAGFKKSNKRPDEYLLEQYVATFGDGDYGADESTLLVKICKQS